MTLDLANWMGNLPPALTNIPINEIAMPGSHDSFSYAIRTDLPIGPDEPGLRWINYFPVFRNVAKRIVKRWWVTQDLTLTQQLENGIRYFDLRLAPNYQTKTIHLIHGLYAMPLTEALKEIVHFLNTHEKEVIILDFQHFHEFTPELHTAVADCIRDLFDKKTCGPTFTDKFSRLTLNTIWERKFQVFVFYRCSSCPYDMWPRQYMSSDWADTTNVNQLINFLERNYKRKRISNKIYVTQGVLTSNIHYVLMHLWSSLKNSLALRANAALSQWLVDKITGENGINIVMHDFVGSNIQLIKQVIDKNYGKDLVKTD